MDRNVFSPAVTKNTSPLHYLSEKQKIFVAAVVKGVAPGTAARQAGYANPEQEGAAIAKSPKVQAAIRFSYQKYAQASQMTRKKVMDGLLEAINIAKIQADAGVMVAGWREIGKMCGYYAPEVKKIELSVTTRRVVDQLEVLSDDDLLKIVDENAQIIEGEAAEVLEHVQTASDAALSAEFGA
jgi:phage terminase small subunit